MRNRKRERVKEKVFATPHKLPWSEQWLLQVPLCAKQTQCELYLKEIEEGAEGGPVVQRSFEQTDSLSAFVKTTPLAAPPHSKDEEPPKRGEPT